MNKTKRKAHGKIALCLFVVCMMTVAFAGTAFAASNPIDISVPVEQTFNITGTDLSTVPGSFDYEMTANNSGDPMPTGAVGDTYSFSLDGTANKDLEMQYTHAGEYLYTVKQIVATEKTGYTYDKEVYTVKVYINNAENGLLDSEVIVQRVDKNKTPSVAFVNAYQPLASDPKLMSDPPVKKTVKGSPATASTFEFKLTAEKSDYPMPDGSKNGVKTVNIVGSGSAEFGVWEYAAAGTYIYTVTETDTDISGYTYDKTVYTIKDVVTDKDGKLILTRTVKDSSGNAAANCEFTNTYRNPNGPKTGDDANNTWWIVLLCVAGIAATGCVIYLFVIKKHKKDSSVQ